MHHQVCTISPHRAILAPFLPVPDLNPALAVAVPTVCLCGGAIDMEMERELGMCVNCQAEAAGLSHIHITSAGPCARLSQPSEA